MDPACIEDTPPYKKMKLEEETSNVQHGVNDDEKENKTTTESYFVKLWAKDAFKLESSGADPVAHFRGLLKAAGCCPESKIRPTRKPGNRIGCLYFYAELTPEEAQQLSALDTVKLVVKERHYYYRPQTAF